MQVLGWGITTTTVCVGIFSLIKRVAGKSLTGIKHEMDKVVISIDDGNTIDTDENTLKVFLDVKCRMSVEKIVNPVNFAGIESFEL